MIEDLGSRRQKTDGKAALDVGLEQETVWLNQRQMAELFDKDTAHRRLFGTNVGPPGRQPG